VRDAFGLAQELLALGQRDALGVLVTRSSPLQLRYSQAQRHDFAAQAVELFALVRIPRHVGTLPAATRAQKVIASGVPRRSA